MSALGREGVREVVWGRGEQGNGGGAESEGEGERESQAATVLSAQDQSEPEILEL